MSHSINGIHHITAIAGDPQRNLDFYTGLLGLRLVKRTVNFDAPDTYHFYYGDERGQPGTILTFFPFPGAIKGRRGAGQVAAIAFAVPAGALAYWTERLARAGVTVSATATRFAEEVLAFDDPDGLALELIAQPGASERPFWESGPVPSAYATRGFHAATLWLRDHEPTARLLTETMGLRLLGQEGRRYRFAAASDGPGHVVDLLSVPDSAPGSIAAGGVHHIAWRTPDDAQELAWREELTRQGLDVTSVRDRQYFRSIYFNEPGGVLFEIATDTPGFATDETVEDLGTSLKLPPWLEPRRAQLERALPPLRAAALL